MKLTQCCQPASGSVWTKHRWGFCRLNYLSEKDLTKAGTRTYIDTIDSRKVILSFLEHTQKKILLIYQLMDTVNGAGQ